MIEFMKQVLPRLDRPQRPGCAFSLCPGSLYAENAYLVATGPEDPPTPLLPPLLPPTVLLLLIDVMFLEVAPLALSLERVTEVLCPKIQVLHKRNNSRK